MTISCQNVKLPTYEKESLGKNCQGFNDDKLSDYGFAGVGELTKLSPKHILEISKEPETFAPCMFEYCKNRCKENTISNPSGARLVSSVSIKDEDICGCYYPPSVYHKLDERLNSYSGLLPQQESVDNFTVDPATSGLVVGGAGRACRYNMCANASIPINRDFVNIPWNRDDGSETCTKPLKCPNIRSARCLQTLNLNNEDTVFMNSPTIVDQQCEIKFKEKKESGDEDESGREHYKSQANDVAIFYRTVDGNLAVTNIAMATAITICGLLIILAFALSFFARKTIHIKKGIRI